MGSAKKDSTPKWIIVATGLAGLVAALLIIVTRYYEMRKLRAEAARIEAEGAPDTTPRVPTPRLLSRFRVQL